MQTKRPMIKETVGSLYLAFNTPTEDGEFDPSTYDETIKSDVVKTITTSDNGESTVVRASGQDYATVNSNSSIENDVEVLAFDPADLAKARGDVVDESGLILSGAPTIRPFFAFGKVVKKIGGAVEYVWYPKCQLIENSEEAKTSEESFSEQNDTLKIAAYDFDGKGTKSVRVNSEMSNFPKELTEEKFFTKPILTIEAFKALIAIQGA